MNRTQLLFLFFKHTQNNVINLEITLQYAMCVSQISMSDDDLKC